MELWESFGAIGTALVPDLIKIKANFLPIITIDPKKESPIGRIFQPKVYLIKGQTIVKLDPQTKKIEMVSPEELKKVGMNVIDFLVFGLIFLIVYKGTKALLRR